MKRIFRLLFGFNPKALREESIKALSAFNETLEKLKSLSDRANEEVSKKSLEISEIEDDIAMLQSIKVNNDKIIANIEKILN